MKKGNTKGLKNPVTLLPPSSTTKTSQISRFLPLWV